MLDASNIYLPSNKPKITKSDLKEDFATRWQRILSTQPSYQLIEHVRRKAADQFKTVMADKEGNKYSIYTKKRLAKGGCCKVKLAKNHATNEVVILKISGDGEEKATSESLILDKLGLLRGLQFVTNKDDIDESYLFMKLIPGITLEKFKELCKSHREIFTIKEQAQILLSMLEAFQGLVKLRINHDDINDGNVMFDPITFKTHFIDFGDATIIAENGTGNHHQHYDLRKLYSLLELLITAPELNQIATHYIFTWEKLESNLQKAIDEVTIIVNDKEAIKENVFTSPQKK